MGYFDDCKEEDVSMNLDQGEYGAVIELTMFDMLKDPVEASIKYKITHASKKGALGAEVWANYKMSMPQKGFFFKTMTLLGKDASSCQTIQDVAEMIHSVKGMSCEIFVKLTEKKNTPGEFWQNAYCNGTLNPAKFLESADPVLDAVMGEPCFDANQEIPF